VIARLWKTGIAPGRAEAYEAFARDVSLPMFHAQPGFLGVVMGRDVDRDPDPGTNRAWVLTLWQDQAAVDALAASPTYQATVAAILAAGLLAGEQTTEVSAVHLLDISPPPGPPPK
jgi:heme-degrading monooxygenase HmoA